LQNSQDFSAILCKIVVFLGGLYAFKPSSFEGYNKGIDLCEEDEKFEKNKPHLLEKKLHFVRCGLGEFMR
jgi:hypothetical protein